MKSRFDAVKHVGGLKFSGFALTFKSSDHCARFGAPINTDQPMNAPSATPKVIVTDTAFERVAEILSETPDKNALRISVEGGGCSGFSYKYELVDEAAGADDQVFEKDGARIYIDEMSLVYMGGSQVDFVDNLMGQAFQINNPNAVASCGCGTSFSV